MISDSAAPVIDENQTLGAVMVFHDVTEQKALQSQLEFGDRLTSLGTMAAGTAHELNNPLGIVMANAGFVAQDLVRHRNDLRAGAALQALEQRVHGITQRLEDIQLAAGRMASIISDLQVFSRPAQDSGGPVNASLCVRWAVSATVREFHHRARLLTLLGEVPLVRADEARLGQVIVNLLINAAQAIPPGNADRNEVTVTTYTDVRGRAVIEVQDTGIGITPDVLARIFDPFFTTKAPGTGTGLGLSICHSIVLSLGGEITVDSQVGKGTTFCVLLPPALTSTESAPGIVETSNLLHGRILVVDDEEMLLRIIELALKEAGHDVISASTGSRALTLIEEGERFDVILCDLMMPNKTGMEVYETLLNHHPDLARRMIFMSGGATTERADAFLKSVDNPMVDKPFTPDRLLRTVQQLLVGLD